MADALFDAAGRLGSSAPGVHEMTQLVREEGEGVKRLVEEFSDGVGPEDAKDAVHRFRMDFPHTGDLQAVARLRLIALRLHADLAYIAADVEEYVVQLADRAFLHLQRSIMVDAELRQKWSDALDDKGEVTCEQLGSVHLLSHGIWAFKASATGERTDLLLGDHLVVDNVVRRSTVGMTLTEWKVVHPESNVAHVRDAAIAQARCYAEGSLAGFEVRMTRFIVLVSRVQLTVPEFVSDRDMRYRIVNIAVAPLSPSKVARIRKQRH